MKKKPSGATHNPEKTDQVTSMGPSGATRKAKTRDQVTSKEAEEMMKMMKMMKEDEEIITNPLVEYLISRWETRWQV